MLPRGLLVTVWGLSLLFTLAGSAYGQQRPDTTRRPVGVPDTTDVPAGADSLRGATQKGRPDSLRQDRPAGPPNRSGPGPDGPNPGTPDSNAVVFSARDSLVIRSDSATSDRGTLHGESNVSYQGTTLRARTIGLNFQTGTLKAEGPPTDSLPNSRPVFQQGSGSTTTQGTGGQTPTQPSGASAGAQSGGGQSFTGDVLSYNLNTKRGRVVGGRTEKRNAFIEGGAVKLFEDSTLFVRDGSYTTCDCPPGKTPSYSLRSDEMKVQGKWVYTGPIQLFLFNVPTPLWLPFGFLPNVEGRRSGPLAPQYGEDRRGFFLKNFGWYFALNQYTDLTLQGSVWSKGSFEIRPRFRYRKRYNYNGDLRFTYRRVRIGEEEDPNPVRRHEGQLRWNHSQELSPTASIRGDVNLTTTGDFAQRNSESFNDAVRQDISSNLSYRKDWPNGGRQLSVSARQNQQLQSGEVRLTLPNLNFSQNSFKPFKADQRVGEERWYEKITTSYRLDVTNNYTFRPRDPERLRQNGTREDSTLANEIERADIDWYEALFNRDKYELATGDDELYDFEATHQIPLDMTFRVDRYNLSFTPRFDYTSDWYLSTVRPVARLDSAGTEIEEVVERQKPGFYARRNFNTSVTAGSEVFGTFPIGLGPFEGLRHRLSPSLTANYRPNFNDPFWGQTRPLRFEDGTVVPDSFAQAGRYDIVTGSRVTRSTQDLRLSFSLRNVFETKRVRVDSTGQKETERLKLLNLDVSGLSYDFAADSFQVGRSINVNARTRIDPFDISTQSTFSPYALEQRALGDGRFRFREVDRLMVAESPLTPARLTRFQVNLSANFSGEGGGGRGSFRGGRPGRRPRGGRTPGRRGRSSTAQSGRSRLPQRSQGQSATPELTSFNPTWSLDLNFNYSLQKPQKEVTNRNATLGANFTLNVTPLWRVRGNTGYDFISDEVSTTRLSIDRSLGCWNMSFSWVPFGRFQQYSFTLQVSSGHLSQLLRLQVPNQGGEGRFGGFGEQLRNTAQGATGIQGGGIRGRPGGGGFP
jgi:lipopolysaccharide assembly outer membrane protein LptD (OstA)